MVLFYSTGQGEGQGAPPALASLIKEYASLVASQVRAAVLLHIGSSIPGRSRSLAVGALHPGAYASASGGTCFSCPEGSDK